MGGHSYRGFIVSIVKEGRLAEDDHITCFSTNDGMVEGKYWRN